MTNEELAKSILMDLEGGYISHGNFHGNNEQGLNLIKGAIEKQIAKPVKNPFRPFYCPSCGTKTKVAPYCWKCGQHIEYRGEEWW